MDRGAGRVECEGERGEGMRYVMTYPRWTALVAAHAARNPHIDPRTVRAAEIARLRGEG